MYKTFFILYCSVALDVVALAQSTQQQPGALDKRPVKIVAHRGASKFAPENTIAAFLKAAEMGAHYAEMDVRQTKDGHFIIMHDQSVKRTTNGKGWVNEMTLDEIRKLDAGSWFGKEFEGEKVPTLLETLRAIKGKITPDIDFKAGDPVALVKLLEKEGWLEDSTVTFHGTWKDAREVVKLTRRILIRPSAKDGVNGLQKLMDELNPPVVNVNRGGFSEYYLNLIHQRGKLAFVNALRRADNERFMKRALDAGADFFQSDRLDLLVPLVKEGNGKQ